MENYRSLPNPNHDHLHHQNRQTPNKSIEHKPIKVKYISNPMMVKAKNESEFRAIVQKLTGQHSADDAFDQSPEEFNQVFYDPPPSTAQPSFDPKDRVYDPVGGGEGRYWLGSEMEGCSFSGFQSSSCVDIW